MRKVQTLSLLFPSQFDIRDDCSDRSSTTSVWSWVESVNIANGLFVPGDVKHEHVDDDASTISSDLSFMEEYSDDNTSVDISDLSYGEDNDYLDDSLIEELSDENTSAPISDLSIDEDDDDDDSLTTVTYLSDFSIFLGDSDDSFTTVTSLSNYTLDLFDVDDVSISDLDSLDFSESENDGGDHFQEKLNILDQNNNHYFTLSDIVKTILDRLIVANV